MPTGAAPPDVPVPPALERLIGHEPSRLVWVNELGGLTYEVGLDDKRRFFKWAPAGSGLDLAAEAERLGWANAFVTVPSVIDQGTDLSGAWLVTTPVPGTMAIAEPWASDPAVAVRAIGQGLRAIHDTLPVQTCPFSWSAAVRVADAQRRSAAGLIDAGEWHEDHEHLTVADALKEVSNPPTADLLVVCHGDACSPNTLIGDDGLWSGHVDLGSLGVADRWADLAIATWSTVWNYGPGWEQPLLDAYGITEDVERTTYYRLLWTLGP